MRIGDAVQTDVVTIPSRTTRTLHYPGCLPVELPSPVSARMVVIVAGPGFIGDMTWALGVN